MDTTVIRASRWKVSLAFSVMAIATAYLAHLAMITHGPAGWSPTIFAIASGAISLLFLAGLLRPPRLVLAQGGFSIENGLLNRKMTVPWSDVSEFVLWNYRGWPSVGWRLQPHVADRPMITVNGQVGRYGRMANMWDLGPKKLVGVLNAYRERATGNG